MRSKNVVKMLTFFTVLGIIALFGTQVNSQTVKIFAESIEARPSVPDITPEAYMVINGSWKLESSEKN